MHGGVRELDSARIVVAQHAGLRQHMNIRMHCAHVAADAPRGLAQRDRPGAGQGLHQCHPVGREHLPEPIERLERDPLLLRFACERSLHALLE
jgi:hypothetical protein